MYWTQKGRRITPACAGKTSRERPAESRRADHPRVCGENLGLMTSTTAATGSPPRVRGKRRTLSAGSSAMRITPACAGKTCTASAHICERTDHPRVCGENVCSIAHAPALYGSPPRVRGKHAKKLRRVSEPRITPACAGKTRRPGGRGCWTADHPRVCGENTDAKKALASEDGSPPRVRGKPLASSVYLRCRRITPACAGKTPRQLCLPALPPDHPRVCGENGDDSITAWRLNGSPPRVRGKPDHD